MKARLLRERTSSSSLKNFSQEREEEWMGCSIIAARLEYGAFSSPPMKRPPPVPGIKEADFPIGPLPVLSWRGPSSGLQLPSLSLTTVATLFMLISQPAFFFPTQLEAAHSTDFSPHPAPSPPRDIYLAVLRSLLWF